MDIYNVHAPEKEMILNRLLYLWLITLHRRFNLNSTVLIFSLLNDINHRPGSKTCRNQFCSRYHLLKCDVKDVIQLCKISICFKLTETLYYHHYPFWSRVHQDLAILDGGHHWRHIYHRAHAHSSTDLVPVNLWDLCIRGVWSFHPLKYVCILNNLFYYY